MSELRTSQDQGDTRGLLPAVMASCRDAIIACSLDGDIEAWNRGAEEIYGFSRQEALGRPLKDLVPDEHSEEIAKIVSESVAGRAVEHFETVRLRRNGKPFPAAVCGFPLKNPSGKVVGFATIDRDITDRVRTAGALRSALAAAEAASETKSRFLANVSHELRTPMNAIVGMTALALEEDVSSEMRDFLETIRDSSDAMVNLINDVLDLSRFESEEFELEEIDFDFRETIESASKVLGAAAHSKGLELVCRIAPETPHAVVGDPARLRQVLTNLIGNAVKFTSSGQVVVEASPAVIESNRCRLRVSVSDTGIGICQKDIKHIFAPFTQVDGSSIRLYGGSGLGLAITRHLVECFGSELQVESEVGRGSRFWFEFTLPLAKRKPPKSEKALTQQIRGLSVLVVDDNAASRTALVEQLEAWGMRPDAAESGKEAMTRLREAAQRGKGYDLAVIDALMPDIDGFSVVSHIEGDRSIKTKPILMASTTDRLEFSRRCAEAGASAFVQKPISQSQLFGAVSQATGAAALEEESRLGLYDRPLAPPQRVLLVEDTPANRKVVQRVLQRRGHEVVIAVNGREALDAYRGGEYDLILMDVQMPIMDGLQATEAIREIERRNSKPPARILALTAHSLRGDRERCLRAGMNGYLAKPLNLAELLDNVENPGDKADPNSARLPPSCTNKPDDSAAMQQLHPNKAADLEVALSRLRNDKSLLIDLIGLFVEDAPKLRAELRESYRDADWPTLQRTAHSLKGLAANFDAEPLVLVSRRLEEAAEAGDASRIPSLLDSIDERCQELVNCLEDYKTSQA